MAEPGGSLQIDEDMGFQRREWRLQRGGRLLLGLVLVAALFGVFGNGPLSHTTAKAGGVRIDFQRFVRSGGHVEMTAHVPASTAPDGQVVLWLPNAFLAAVEVESVSPEPSAVEARGDGVAYVFTVPTQPEALQAVFQVRPQQEGLHRGQLQVNERRTVHFWQLIYP